MTRNGLRRVLFCGAVDDGKSTLLGRLLADTGSATSDELDAATTTGTLDYSTLTDGLMAEREQGITIDVAYRHLRLPGGNRAILADCPGHEQYTLNMSVAASTSEVAVVVVDATRGVRQQTLRHLSICALMGLHSVVVAVTKIDAVDDPALVFQQTKETLGPRIEELGMSSVRWIPTSALRGDNVVVHSDLIPWYDGPTLVESLLDLGSGREREGDALRLPIQTVIRAGVVRWYSGRLSSGSVAVGDRVSVPTSGVTATVAEVAGARNDGPVRAGDAVRIRLDSDIDLKRGDLLVHAEDPRVTSRAFLCEIIWLDAEPMALDKSYLLRSGPMEIPARVDTVLYVTTIDDGRQSTGRPLVRNDLGRVEVVTDRPVLLDPYDDKRDTGGFVLVERSTARTVAVGMVVHPVQRESEVVRHSFSVDRAAREELNGFRSGIIWLTGLSGSGKSTIADALGSRLHEMGIRSYTLDGDAIRSTLSEDLGFSPEDRAENVRRVARVAGLMMDAGILVIVSLVSPFRSDRLLAKEHFASSEFLEVFVDTPLDVCRERDPKGLYARSLGNATTELTGVGQAYEPPENPDLRLDGQQPVADSVARLLDFVIPRRIG